MQYILFVGALFASLRNHCNKVIPMPTGMGRVLINISFCVSVFVFAALNNVEQKHFKF